MLLRGKRLPLIMTRHIVHQYRRPWFSRLSFHRSMVGRRLPALQTATGMAYLAFCGEAEREHPGTAGHPRRARLPLGPRPPCAGQHPAQGTPSRLRRELHGLEGSQHRLHCGAPVRRQPATTGLCQPDLHRQGDEHRTGPPSATCQPCRRLPSWSGKASGNVRRVTKAPASISPASCVSDRLRGFVQSASHPRRRPARPVPPPPGPRRSGRNCHPG